MQNMHEKVQNDNEDSWDGHLTIHTKFQMLLFAKFVFFVFEENATYRSPSRGIPSKFVCLETNKQDGPF